MRTIGILGGMSWESTAKYYQIINNVVYERLGGLNSARMIIYSFNFDQISKLQKKGSWTAAGEELARGRLIFRFLILQKSMPAGLRKLPC